MFDICLDLRIQLIPAAGQLIKEGRNTLMFNEMEFSTYYEAIAFELRASLARYYDVWLDVLCKEEAEQPLYVSTVEQKRINIVVLSCALLEHTINFYLSTKCKGVDFEKLERKSVIKKWTAIPKQFVPAYGLATGSDLEQDLNSVVNRRNAIVHAKPKLSIDGDNRHAGNEPVILLDENEFIGRCATVPFRLLENLLNFDHDAFIAMSSVRTSCGAVMQELNGARSRFNYVARMPEELVAQIREQGYRRDRAKLFAALIGEVPIRRKDGSIPVRRYGEVIALLKPLKFFAASGFMLDLSDPALSLQNNDQMS